MSLPRAYVDGFLVEWEAGEYKAQVKMLRATSKAIRLFGSEQGAGRGTGTSADTAKRAQAVRERLARTVRRVPEVMVKITSGSKGMKQIGRHFNYISRDGQIELEDQDGLVVKGKAELKELKDDWRSGGLEPIGETSDRRDTLNIVFSMPAQTDEVSLKRALRAFAKTEFARHSYVFAYHTPSTDPDPDPPDHPHIHLSVKIEGHDGRRLNPRKADLQRWREGFAHELRAHGIEANATSRLARLRRDRGEKRGRVEAQARGASTWTGRTALDPERLAVAQKLEKDRIDYVYAASKVLGQSEDPTDRALAVDIARHLQMELKVKAPAIARPEPER
ncbi:hypothetical protein [Asticcacaulis sp. W401b]|uniref:hypothetical protein n=1 Tax=Asticcacaulis sp. W401b TaxID=3388666 RepID=UPI003970AF5D